MDLSELVAEPTSSPGAGRSAQWLEDLAREACEQADVIRRALAGRDAPTD